MAWSHIFHEIFDFMEIIKRHKKNNSLVVFLCLSVEVSECFLVKKLNLDALFLGSFDLLSD